MSDLILHTLFMAGRQLRNLLRQPWFIAISLMQPVIYLLLFASLFSRVASLPGFGSKSYVTFLAPGLVIMTALFSAGWNGMGMINDIDRGWMDRFLVTPVRRESLVTGRLVQLSATIVIQSAIIIVLALIRGASFENGLPGMLALIAAAVLLAAPFGAMSTAIALTMRTQESMIATVNMVLLPLTFLSTLFMAKALMPSWMRSVAAYNPVNWAVGAGRQAVSVSPDWTSILLHFGYLALLTLFGMTWAMLAFRSYQRSV